MAYPIIDDTPPWLNTDELGQNVTVDGTAIVAVPVRSAITSDIDLGMGFEAEDTYILCAAEDLAPLGDLHGKAVVIGSDNYLVRNVRPKKDARYVRLVLDER